MLFELCGQTVPLALLVGLELHLRQTFSPLGVAGDALLALDFSLLLRCFQRRLSIAVALAAVLVAVLPVASWTKESLLGAPIALDDTASIPELLHSLPVHLRILLAAGLVGIFGIFLANLRWPLPGWRVLAAPPLTVAALLATKAVFPSALPYASQFLINRIFLAVDALQSADAEDSLGGLSVPADRGLPGRAVPLLQPRSVYIVLMESLIDPVRLPGLSMSADPFAPLFRQWRQESGSVALPPVTGGHSANSEFELLCGLPAILGNDAIVFTKMRRPAIDCLPHKLAARGWSTVATTAVAPDFFGAETAYHRMGFQQSWFLPQLDQSDLDGIWLSTESLLRQNLEMVGPLAATGHPVLDYVFTTSNHWPFELNPTRRPHRITVAGGGDRRRLEAYVNAVHYNTRAVENFVATVRHADPAALVVVLGDHAPPLGRASYGEEARPSAMWETPLLMLDGTAILRLGSVPVYMVPEIILDRLSGGTYCRENDCAWQRQPRLRPYPAGNLLIEGRGPPGRWCPSGEDQPDCQAAARRAAAMKRAVIDLCRED